MSLAILFHGVDARFLSIPLGTWMFIRYNPLVRHALDRLVHWGRRRTEVIILGDIGVQSPCELLFPHFMFTDAYISHEVYRRMRISGSLLIDRFLHRASPNNWVSGCISSGGLTTDELTGNTIRRCLASGKPYCLFPGGFVEAAGITATREVLYIGRLGYHLEQARRAGVGLSIVLVYDANPMFVNIAPFGAVRCYLARRGFPVIMPDPFHFVKSLMAGNNTVFARRLHIDAEMDKVSVGDLILRTYKTDAEDLLQAYGVRLRVPEIHSQDESLAPMR